MTDTEIIKALEYCSQQGVTSECERCKVKKGCRSELIVNALDLINRQKAEKETMQSYIDCLKAEIERLEDLNKCYYTSCQQIAKSNHEIKAEAVKEFAERVKEKFACLEYVIQTNRKTLPIERVKAEIDAVLQNGCSNVVDKILKEMVGEI